MDPMTIAMIAKTASSMFGSGQDKTDNMGTTLGAGQLVSSLVKKRQAEGMKPAMVDPLQSKLYQEAAMKRRQYESGYDPMSAVARNEISSQLAGTTADTMKRAGGNVGLAMAGAGMAQNAAGTSVNKTLAGTAERTAYYDQLQGKYAKDITDRRFNLQMWNTLQKLRESAQQQKYGYQNLLGGSIDKSGAEKSDEAAIALGRQILAGGTESTTTPNERAGNITPMQPKGLPQFSPPTNIPNPTVNFSPFQNNPAQFISPQ